MVRALACVVVLTLSTGTLLAQKARRPLIHAGVVTTAHAGRGLLKVSVGAARAARNLEFRLADDVPVIVWNNGEKMEMTARQALAKPVFKKGARVHVHVNEGGTVTRVEVGRPRAIP